MDTGSWGVGLFDGMRQSIQNTMFASGANCTSFAGFDRSEGREREIQTLA